MSEAGGRLGRRDGVAGPPSVGLSEPSDAVSEAGGRLGRRDGVAGPPSAGLSEPSDSPTESRWLDVREAAAWQAVRDLGQPLWTALGRDLQRESGLSLADYQVLVVLSESRGGVLKYGTLAESTGWEKSRLSHHLTRMERRGLVRREECADDGRCANILLTDRGRCAIAAAAPGHVASVRRLLIDQLSEDQIDALIAIGRQVRANVDGACSADDAWSADADAAPVTG